MHEVIMEEWKLNGERSTLGLVLKLASEYGFEDMTMTQLNKVQRKQVIRMKHDMEVWRDSLASSITMTRPYLRLRDKRHFKWSKLQSQALLGWRTGSLKFRSTWKVYNTKHGLSSSCVFPLCSGIDSWSHMIQCPWYTVKWNPKFTEEEEIATYILKVSMERLKRLRMPLL